jgi:hypothetical protein
MIGFIITPVTISPNYNYLLWCNSMNSDVSEEYNASNFEVQKMPSNSKKPNVSACFLPLFAWFNFRNWRQRQYVSPKRRWTSTVLHATHPKSTSNSKYRDVTPESRNSPLLANGSKHVSVTSRNSPLIVNGSLNTFPWQRIIHKLLAMVI